MGWNDMNLHATTSRNYFTQLQTTKLQTTKLQTNKSKDPRAPAWGLLFDMVTGRGAGHVAGREKFWDCLDHPSVTKYA